MNNDVKDLLNTLQTTLIQSMIDRLGNEEYSSAQIMKEARQLLLDNGWTTEAESEGNPLQFLSELAGDDADTLDKTAVPGDYLSYLKGKEINEKTG